MSPGPESLGGRMEDFWAALENADERRAVDQVTEALDRGFAPEDVLLEIIAPAQRRVGVRWAENRLTVAQEHAATAVSDRAVTAVADHPAAQVPARLGRTVVACADGEWHTLPARLVAEVLRLRGWQVDFLGAHVSTRQLVPHLHSTGPDAVALSCSLPVRLPVAHTAVTACRAAGVPVLAGGAGFGPDGRYARLLGADAWAGSARGAAERLAAGIAPPSELPPTAEEALPHLADREHALVDEARGRLVDEVMAVLPERFPQLREYAGPQWEYTVEDLHRVVEYLVAALYVDDPGLFEGFTAWTGRIMTARSLPVDALSTVLEAMADAFRELPRASAYIAAAQAALDRELHSPPP
ncbi:cobalamin B12-binding domain-containing protein [Streptomyces barkulensis]|uniref:cobalamin B12-binding domain-containing protein n=2 Tax=Streptomyces barkulensis TaxID=1257026 RepID=UPI001F4E2F6D|nr:cobalamin-dependent protein [Streptomyces barkulensis]